MKIPGEVIADAARSIAASQTEELRDAARRGAIAAFSELGEDHEEVARLLDEAISAALANGNLGSIPTIEVTEDLSLVDRTLDALAARCEDLQLYVRARRLVEIVRDGSAPETWITRWPGSPEIRPVNAQGLMGKMGKAAHWVKRYSKHVKPHRPPKWAADMLLNRAHWKLPYLEGVIETPTIRRDGSILSSPGWDAETGLLYAPLPSMNGWPEIPGQPTRGDVEKAVDTAVEPFSDFPFIASSDEATVIAAILSLLARHLIDGPVPMFAIRAPTPASGKTLLANAIGVIGTGRQLPVMAHTHESEELRKRITSLAVAGSRAILVDNLSGAIGSDVLAGALTATDWEDRILGVQEMVRTPLRCVWIATGNNVGFKRTLGRRVLPIDIDAGIENPEDRTNFIHDDLLPWVTRTRPKIVTACLTVLRAFILDGAPRHGGARMGSFEAWDDIVRSCLLWAGMKDPASTDPDKGRGRIRSTSDDDTEELASMLSEIGRAFPDTAATAAEIVKEAEADRQLAAALELAASSKGGKVTVRSLGYALRSSCDRPCKGHVLRRGRTDKSGNMKTWIVENVPRFGGDEA